MSVGRAIWDGVPRGAITLLFTVVLLGAALGAGVGVQHASAATTITSCQTISSGDVPADGIVNVGQNLSASSGDCLTITASNVTIDGQENFVSGGTTAPAAAIAVDGSSTALTNVTVRNVTVNGSSNGVHYFGDVTASTVTDVNATGNDRGIFLNGSTVTGTSVSDFNVTSASNTGVIVAGDSNTVTNGNTTGQTGSLNVPGQDNQIRNVDATSSPVVLRGANNTLDSATVSSSSGVGVSVTAPNNTIESTTVTNSGSAGIQIDTADGTLVVNSTVDGTSGATDGIDVLQSDDVLIRNTTVTNASNQAISSFDSSSTSVRNLTVVESRIVSNGLNGLDWVDTFDSTVRDTVIESNGAAGVEVTDGGNNTFVNVTVRSNADEGFIVDDGSTTIRQSTVRDNGLVGIDADSSTTMPSLTVRNTTVAASASAPGIDVSNVDSVTIADTTVENFSGTGINVVPTSGAVPNTTIRRTTVRNVSGDGIVLDSGTDPLVEDTTVTDASGNRGIRVTSNVTSPTLRNVTVTNPGTTGIYVQNADGTVIEDSTVNPNGQDGVFLVSTANTVVRDTTVDGGSQAFDASGFAPNLTFDNVTTLGPSTGLILRMATSSTENVVVKNSQIDGNNRAIDIDRDVDTTNVVVRNNTITGGGASTSPLVVAEDLESLTVEGNAIRDHDAGGLAVINDTAPITNGVYRDNTVSNVSGTGILLEAADGSLVENNTVTGVGTTTDHHGINVSSATSVTLRDNEIDGASGNGVLLDSVMDSVVNGTNSRNNANDGIALDSSDNVTVENAVLDNNNVYGLQLTTISDITVQNVTATNNFNGVRALVASGTYTLTDVEARGNSGDGIVVDGTTITDSVTENNGGQDLVADGASTSLDNVTVGSTTYSTGTVQNVNIKNESTPESVPADLESVDAFANITARSGTSYADVTVSYTDSQGAGVDEDSLSLYRYNGTGYEEVAGGSNDPAANTVSDNVTTFSTVAPLGIDNAIASCREINESVVPDSRVVNLESDLSASGTCVTIVTSDVTFDGQGHTITGSGSGDGVLVDNASTDVSNVTVRNLTTDGFGQGVQYGDSNGASGLVENVTAVNATDGALLTDTGSSGVTVRNGNFSNNGDGLTVVDTATVEDNTIENNSDDGVELTGTATVASNAFRNNTVGVQVSAGATVRDNAFTGTDTWTVTLSSGSASNALVESNTMTNVGGGVEVTSSNSGVTVRDNVVRNTLDNKAGVAVTGATNATLVNNTVDESDVSAVFVAGGAENVTVRDGTYTNSSIGVRVDNANDTVVRDVTVRSSNGSGILLAGAGNVRTTLDGVTVTDAAGGGIGISQTTDTEVLDATVTDSELSGLLVDRANGTLVRGGVYRRNNAAGDPLRGGIRVNDSADVTVDDVTVENNTRYGVLANVAPRLRVEDSRIVDNCGGTAGIGATQINDSVFVRNNISNNTGVGMQVSSSYRVEIRDSTINDNGAGGSLTGLSSESTTETESEPVDADLDREEENGEESEDGAVRLQTGVRGSGGNWTVENVTANGNGGDGLRLPADSTARDVTAMNNTDDAIDTTDRVTIETLVAVNNSVGVTADDNITVRDATFRRNTFDDVDADDDLLVDGMNSTATDGDGVEADDRVTVRNAVVRNHDGDGVDVDNDGTIRNVTVVDDDNTGDDGLETSDNALIVDSVVRNNDGDGINTDDNPRIRNFTAVGNGEEGIDADGTGTVIRNATVLDNLDNGIEPGSNSLVVNTTVANSADIDFDGGSESGVSATNLTVGTGTIRFGSLEAADVELVERNNSTAPATPSDLYDVDAYVNITNTSLSAYANVSIAYTDAAAVDVDEDTLEVYRYNGTAWTNVSGSTNDPANNRVSANLTTFSNVTALGEFDDPPTAQLTASPSRVSPGVAVDFDASGSADNDSAITAYEWDFDGDGVVDRTTTSPTTSFVYRTSQTVDASVRVVSAAKNDTATTPVTVSTGGGGGGGGGVGSDQFANINVESLSLSSQRIAAGDTVTVTVRVSNTGRFGDTALLELDVDGQTVAEKSVTLGAGQTKTLTFTRQFSRPGEYALTVDGQQVGILTVGGGAATETPAPATETPTPTTETPAPETPAPETPADETTAGTPTSGGGPGFGAVVALVALLAVAALAVGRRER